MSNYGLPILLALGLVLGGSLLFLAIALWLIKGANQVSRAKRTIRFVLAGILALPFLPASLLVAWFTIDNFPFTSGVAAHDLAPNGDEICIVQTFKDADPYQVSLFARHAGQPWIWNYLAHEDGRWRNCHTEFAGDSLRVYTGSTLRKTLSLAAVTTVPAASASDPDYQLPAEFTPQQILAWHNKKYRW
jgi:hypothetical protein